MTDEEMNAHHPGRHHHGEGQRRRGHDSEKRGAKTFRRGRAIAFLERMESKRSALKKQLETPELQTIHPILVGELKAVDMVINEFVQLFELYEYEEIQTANPETNEVDTKEHNE